APSQPTPAPHTTPAPPIRPKRHRLGFVLLLLVSLPIAVYIVLWLYDLLLSQFDVAAPAVAVAGGSLVLALVGPWPLGYHARRVRRTLAEALRAMLRAFWWSVARMPLAHALARRLLGGFPAEAPAPRRRLRISPLAGLLLIAVLFAASAGIW